jgi:hypothetical protein
LIERLGLLFQQRQIMQRVVDEIGRLVAAWMHGDRRITADDLNPVDISLRLPNKNGNDGTIARFGWKAQNKSLLIFSGEAYNVR